MPEQAYVCMYVLVSSRIQIVLSHLEALWSIIEQCMGRHVLK